MSNDDRLLSTLDRIATALEAICYGAFGVDLVTPIDDLEADLIAATNAAETEDDPKVAQLRSTLEWLELKGAKPPAESYRAAGLEPLTAPEQEGIVPESLMAPQPDVPPDVQPAYEPPEVPDLPDEPPEPPEPQDPAEPKVYKRKDL